LDYRRAYVVHCSAEAEGSGDVNNLSVPLGEEQRLALDEDMQHEFSEPVHWRGGIYRLHQHYGQQVGVSVMFCLVLLLFFIYTLSQN